jgi:hypothetical protein
MRTIQKMSLNNFLCAHSSLPFVKKTGDRTFPECGCKFGTQISFFPADSQDYRYSGSKVYKGFAWAVRIFVRAGGLGLLMF